MIYYLLNIILNLKKAKIFKNAIRILNFAPWNSKYFDSEIYNFDIFFFSVILMWKILNKIK